MAAPIPWAWTGSTLSRINHQRTTRYLEADAIAIEEIENAGLYRETSQAFAVLLPVQSVGVMGMPERTKMQSQFAASTLMTL